ncbi:MAG: phosphatase PAP2 family protein, partial [Anaerolineae bacterium]|nr:phosphatase PAP2 family protein [Anaerolineae bacterium]
VGRFRPEVDYIPNALPELTASFQRYAFPSGHACSATVACFSWVAVLWRWPKVRWIALVIALLIWLGAGYGRFYMGLHWPTDVLGGYFLAGAWMCAAMGVRSRVFALPPF